MGSTEVLFREVSNPQAFSVAQARVKSIYEQHYAESGLGKDSCLIVRETRDGRIGWSFSRGGVRVGERVTLNDDITRAVVLSVHDDDSFRKTAAAKTGMASN